MESIRKCNEVIIERVEFCRRLNLLSNAREMKASIHQGDKERKQSKYKESS